MFESNKERNQGFENSLRCLQHPLSLFSIGLLLLNEHIFKIINPSWLTRKLSDFAGLFFFPFIVAAGTSLLFSKYKLISQRIGQFSFGLVVIWFILLKTIQSINSLTVAIASVFIKGNAQILLDPTDIIAVTAMIPAWYLWIQSQYISKTKYIAHIALIVGSFAVIATSPKEWTVHSVTNLEYTNDGVVLSADRDGWGENSYPVAKSLDGGTTWESANDISNIEEKSLPIKHCSHINPDLCYQITKFGRLQELKNLNDEYTWINVSGLENIRVYDLILFDWEDKEYVIVAIGEYGIWRKELPNGEWDEISVLRADK